MMFDRSLSLFSSFIICSLVRFGDEVVLDMRGSLFGDFGVGFLGEIGGE